MQKYYDQIWEYLKGIMTIIFAGVGLLLLFLWFPDFVNWLSDKLTLITEGTIVFNTLGLLPLFVLVGGIAFFVILEMLSITYLKPKT